MPIYYNKEISSWELKDATEDEKEALLNLAINQLVEVFGEQAAHKIFETAGIKVVPTLEGMNKESMGLAQ